MSEKNTSWFHCGHCGSLFQSSPGAVDGRLCTSCGRNPSLGIEPPPANDAAPALTPTENSGERGKRLGKKRKRSYFMVKIVLGWSVLVLAIIYGARWQWGEQPDDSEKPVSQVSAKAVVPEEDVILMDEAGPLCNQTFSGFLAAGTPEQQNQFVLSPITTAARMARFFSLNPLVVIDPQKIALSKHAALHLPGRRAIETCWSYAEGGHLDAVFMEENGEWLLDWDHYVRFSEYPWPLFLAGSGPEQAGFRLLARERHAEERKNADTSSSVFYPPRFGSNTEMGVKSPEFLIKRDTKNGRLLDAAFKLEKAGKRVFDVNLPSATPEGFIRVRVKVRRVEEAGERRYELEDVIACHWYSHDAPGVEIPEQPLKPDSSPPASPPTDQPPETNAETPAPPAE